MQTTTDPVSAAAVLEAATAHLDRHGYCIVENAISRAEAVALRTRLTEQAEAEAQIGMERILGDKKQLVGFLLNKGQGFRDLLFHPVMRRIVEHVIGPRHLLSLLHRPPRPAGGRHPVPHRSVVDAAAHQRRPAHPAASRRHGP